MSTFSFLDGLNEEERDLVMTRTRKRHLSRGEYLVRQGEDADAVFYVLHGKFDILREGKHLVAEIGAGEPVGEIAFFSGAKRTADVVAARDSDVLELDRENWDFLTARLPSFNASVLRALGLRLARATATAPPLPSRPPTALGLCPAGGMPVSEDLIQKIIEVFNEDPSTPLTALRAADLPLGLSAEDGPALSTWFAEHEAKLGRLLLVTGQGNEAWDRAALRHCDHLLLCAPLDQAKGETVPLSALESYAMPLFRERQASLVLWRAEAAQEIKGTPAFLKNRKVHLHHHIALDRIEDFRRLHRFLNGRALGAIFGGGGAFGAAHIGALRALYAAGLKFDISGGTSIGSTVAYAVADEYTAAEMIHDFDLLLHKKKPLSGFTLPRYSLFDHLRSDQVLSEHYGENVIEDYALNSYSVGANLSTNKLDVRRRGLIWTAVRASISIPGVLPPWINEEGDVIVDGGIMDNVPLSVMRQVKTGPNIVFSLSPTGVWRVKDSYNDLPTRGQLIRQFLTRQKNTKDLPRLDLVLARSMQVTSAASFKNAHLGRDLLLELPSYPGMGLLSFGLAHKQEQFGYEFTSRYIEAMGGAEGLMAWHRDWQP